MEARKCANGLADGWYNYLTEIILISQKYKSKLMADDLTKINYLNVSIDKKLKKRQEEINVHK